MAKENQIDAHKISDFEQRLLQAHDAIRILTTFKDDGDLAEILHREHRLPADVLAQLLMNALPMENLLVEQKAYWLQVGEYMGSDWIREFRRMGAFMSRTEDFK